MWLSREFRICNWQTRNRNTYIGLGLYLSQVICSKEFYICTFYSLHKLYIIFIIYRTRSTCRCLCWNKIQNSWIYFKLQNTYAEKFNHVKLYCFCIVVVTLESRGGGRYINQFMLQAVSIDSMGKTTVANPGDNGVQAFTQVPVEGYTVSTATDCEVSISGQPVGILMTRQL